MSENKKSVIFLAATLAVCMVMFALAGYYKRIVFCDEVYTYTITNSSKTIQQFEEARWYGREEVKDMLSHTENDSLYQMLKNVKGDHSHPPLYYIFVYIASAIAGGSSSKWIALSVNGVMLFGVLIFFWLIINRLFKSPVMASAAAMLYTLNVGTLSDATLLRMYMQLTFFTVAFAYITLLLYESNLGEDKENNRLYVWLGLVTAGGFLTQYYFSFIAVAAFAVWAVYCLIRRKYKEIIKYFGAMLAAVAVDTILWHYWINDVLSGNDAETIQGNILNFAGIFSSLFNGIVTVQINLFHKWYIAAMIAAVILLALFFAGRRVKNIHRHIKLYVGTLAVVYVFYVAIVYQLTPDYKLSSRYFYAAGMLELLITAICVCALLKTYLNDRKAVKRIASTAVFALCMASELLILRFGYGIDYYGDAGMDDEQRAILEQYEGIPWIICGEETWMIAANFFDYTIPERIMMITDNTPYRSEPVLEEADSFLIIAHEDGDDRIEGDLALYYYIGCTGNFVKSELLMERNGLCYYLAFPVK